MPSPLPRSNGQQMVVIAGPLWDELCDRVEKLEGLKVANGSGLELLDQPGGKVLAAKPRKGGAVLVKISGTASGGGKYTGVIWSPPTVNIPATGDLTEAEVGVTSTSVVRVLNTTEVGKSTHDMAAASYLPLIFPAVFLKTADDGIPVYAIAGFQVYDCEEA